MLESVRCPVALSAIVMTRLFKLVALRFLIETSDVPFARIALTPTRMSFSVGPRSAVFDVPLATRR